jgi:2-keto-4-pentenoate hydratase/2-oxohepta-3-ene-1,7-dioic acid hydratase in catechol pathway
MKAIHFQNEDGEPRLGLLDGDRVVDAGPAPAAGFDGSAQAWEQVARASGVSVPLSRVTILPPVRPSKVLAIGLNYRSHVEETNLQHPDSPVVFAKFPSSIIGTGQQIVIPREETRPDFEGEIAVIVSKRGYRIPLEDAWDYVGGFTALHDVSGRRAQLETPMRQFTVGKSFDTFTPLGPVVAAVDSVDREAIGVMTTINGEVMQEGNSRDLIFSIPELLEYLSRGITLEPGDVIATGTPGGVGDERKPPRYLREGDVVEITVDGVGTLSNPVVKES